MPSPYATNENPADLWYEKSNYISTHIAAIAYGLHVGIFATVMYYTFHQEKKTWRWVGWLGFNTTLFVLGTVNMACSIHFNESAWITERNYPGGPFAFLLEQQTRPIFTLGNSASIVVSLMADGLLLYRAIILWNYKWYIIIAPILLYLVSIVLSILIVIQVALPGVANMVDLDLPVWLILMTTNIVLTAMIATRLLLMRRSIRSILGNEHAKVYTGVVALVVESALPFTIVSIILLGLFGGRNTAQNLFVPLLIQIECIAPELIILRVIRGYAWSKDTVCHTTALPGPIKFAPVSEIEGVRTRSSGNGTSVLTWDDTVPTASHSKEKKDRSESRDSVA